jgi:conserved oligomeric Golgi complex subunit 2
MKLLKLPKAFLHLLLKISESVTRLEALLLIASPEGETVDARPDFEVSGFKDDDTKDDRSAPP